MKERKPGFLSEEFIAHDSEEFDYITELHEYLWQFVRCSIPGASGNLRNYIDIALQKLKQEKEKEQEKEQEQEQGQELL